MLGLVVTIERSGDTQAVVRANRRLGDLRPWLIASGELLLDSAARRLDERDTSGVRSGRLKASLTVGGEGNVSEVTDDSVTVGTNLPYARIQQEGGTIVPREAKALAIPIDDRLKRDGAYPRDVDPTRERLTLITDKDDGRAYLVAVDDLPGYGKGVMFMLVSSVTIPARPFLLIDESDAADIRELLESHVAGNM